MSQKEELDIILLNGKDIFLYQQELFDIIPELIILERTSQNHPAHMYNVLEHTLRVVNNVDNNIIEKLAALFHDIGKAYSSTYVDGIEHFYGHEHISSQLSRFVLKRLGYDEKFTQKVVFLIDHHDFIIKTKDIEYIFGTSYLVDNIHYGSLIKSLLRIKKADLYAHAKQYKEKHKKELSEITEEIYAYMFLKNSK